MTDHQPIAVFTTPGSSRYHLLRDCPALDTAQLYSRGKVTTASTEQACEEQRTPCLVCAAPTADEWTLTTANLGELCELIEWSKPHWGALSAVDGLTIWGASSASGERCWARFGDLIRRESDGRYSIHPAAPTTA